MPRTSASPPIPRSPSVLGSGGTASSTTNSTSEVNLKSVLVPAGIMGLNGHLHIEALYKYVGTAGTKTPRIRHSTTAGDTSAGTLLLSSAVAATSLSQSTYEVITNVNSASAQIAKPGTLLGFGASDTVMLTGSINTAVDSYINFNALVANSGDTAQLVSYTVTFYPGV